MELYAYFPCAFVYLCIDYTSLPVEVLYMTCLPFFPAVNGDADIRLHEDKHVTNAYHFASSLSDSGISVEIEVTN